VSLWGGKLDQLPATSILTIRELRTYIAEPERGERNWEDKQAEKEAVYANRRRIRGARGKKLQAQRGEKIERNFAHQFDTGGMDRLYVRGIGNVRKKLLLSGTTDSRELARSYKTERTRACPWRITNGRENGASALLRTWPRPSRTLG
jgi:hypothetical protein